MLDPNISADNFVIMSIIHITFLLLKGKYAFTVSSMSFTGSCSTQVEGGFLFIDLKLLF